MDYTIPNVSVEHFTKIEPYDGDFATLFVSFSRTLSISKPILIEKFVEFLSIVEFESEFFLKESIDAFFRNGGERLYLLNYQVKDNQKFDILKFKETLTREADRFHDAEVVSAINLYDSSVYNEIFNINEILNIQRVINDYCKLSDKISISDINEDFKDEYLDLLGPTVIYYPWIVNSRNVTLPSSIYASALLSKLAEDAKYFHSIANQEIINTEDVEHRLEQNSLLELVKNRINPVIYMPHRGVRIWGVKTFDDRLDTINELRVLKYIKRKLKKISRMYIFEPNSMFLEAQVILMVNVFLEELVEIGALTSIKVESNKEFGNAEEMIVIDIEVAFSIPIEYIHIRLNKVDRENIEVEEN